MILDLAFLLSIRYEALEVNISDFCNVSTLAETFINKMDHVVR